MKELVNALKKTGKRDLAMALYPWTANTVIGMALTWAGARFFMSRAGEPVFADGRFRYFISTLLHELRVNYPGTVTAMIVIGILIIIALVLVSLFISAGIYGVLAAGERVTVKSLLSRSVKHFGRFFRISLAGIPVWIVSCIIPGVIFYLHKRAQEQQLDESLLWTFLWAWVPITILFVIFASAVVDFARIIGITGNDNVFKAIWLGLKRFLSRWGAVLVLFILYFILTALVFFIQNLLGGWAENMFILSFILYQVIIFSRYFLKAVLMRAEVALGGV